MVRHIRIAVSDERFERLKAEKGEDDDWIDIMERGVITEARDEDDDRGQ